MLGGISATFEARYPGIVTQAVGLSIGTLAMMLTPLWHWPHSGDGEVQDRIGRRHRGRFVSFIWWTLSLAFLAHACRSSTKRERSASVSRWLSWSLPPLNLILDFDFIQKGADQQAPKYMEWYGGFSLLVTLVWMYLEILRLLAKLRGNSRD